MSSPAPHLAQRPEGRSPIDDCVHCGFCLPACPTYVSWGQEMDSPRGRIELARGLRDGRIEHGPAVTAHIDRCLGCMACVTACPSGVRYDHLIEDVRGMVEDHTHRAPRDRFWRGVIFALFPYPRRLRLAALVQLITTWLGVRWLARKLGLLRLSKRLRAMDALAPPVAWRHVTTSLPEVTPAVGPRRARVAMLAGCVQRVFFPGVNEATVRVLAAEGCEVVIPRGQGCCGALSLHAGREQEARGMARALIERLEASGADVVLVNAAGCGSAMKDYGQIFAHDPEMAARAAAFSAKVRDVTEFLAGLAPVARRHPLAGRVAYHSPCHLGHAQGVREQPRKLLRGIPGLELVEIADGEACCGSAGIYNLIQPDSADEIGRRKVDAVLAAKAGFLASANPGCTLQIQKLLRERGLELRAAHPIEILDASIRGVALDGQ